jgi:hypothetical protein
VQPLAAAAPGSLQLVDIASGNLLLQYAVPAVDELAPAPIFTYNSLSSKVNVVEGFGFWSMSFLDTIATGTSSATVNKGTGASFTYTKNAQGQSVPAFRRADVRQPADRAQRRDRRANNQIGATVASIQKAARRHACRDEGSGSDMHEWHSAVEGSQGSGHSHRLCRVAWSADWSQPTDRDDAGPGQRYCSMAPGRQGDRREVRRLVEQAGLRRP